MRVEDPQILKHGLISPRLGCLPLQRPNLSLHFFDDVLNPYQVRLAELQLSERFFFLRLEFRDSGGFFKNGAPILRAIAQNLVDLALLHDRVGAATDARIHEKLVDILQAAGRFIQKIFALPIAINTAGDANFIPLDPQLLLAFRKGHRNLRHTQRWTAIRAAKNHIRHLATAKRLGRLLAEHPTDRVEHVGFSATIWAHHGGDLPVEIQDGFCGEGFESDDFQRLQIHGNSVKRCF